MSLHFLKVFLVLAVWAGVQLLPTAHSQISGTVFPGGGATQDVTRQGNSLKNLRADADAAAQQGDTQRAVQLYLQLCDTALADACLRLADLLEQDTSQHFDPYGAIPFYERACDLGSELACDGVRDAFARAEAECERDDAAACMASAFMRLNNLTEIS